MTVYRLIAPDWLIAKHPGTPRVLEGVFTTKELFEKNDFGYNIYYLPNGPSEYEPGTHVDGSQIDTFSYVFVDMDLKDGTYSDKDAFIEVLGGFSLSPSLIVDSGNGIHAYWKVSDLDAKSYLRLCRRLMRHFSTDEAVGQLLQLMRLPGTVNTKNQTLPKKCEVLYTSEDVYTCEELDSALPPISSADEAYCNQHYDRIHNKASFDTEIDDTLPPKFGQLLSQSTEVKSIWANRSDDRSKDDWRLAHIMFANGFTKKEATSVLINSSKALTRGPAHRISYATNIVDKIWTYELEAENKKKIMLSESVESILKKTDGMIKGERFPCHKWIDNTIHGFRLGQVIGLVAGSGVGKTAFALNMFRWFVQLNPDYHHFFIPLEQPSNEIADRWQTMCGADTSLHKKVHVLSNYDDNGNFRRLSFDEIKAYILEWQKETGNKIGCVVIDHIGALKKKGSREETQDLMTICHSMKAFAIETNTLLVMQSQTTREKAGIGDLELNKDAAYGTIFFESYCDYLITLWQPLKRCHSEPSCPTVTAFKFCKIRHKKAKRDVIQEDVPYYLNFNSETELLQDLTEDQRTSFKYYLSQSTNKRKADRKTDIVEYKSVAHKESVGDGTADSNRQA